MIDKRNFIWKCDEHADKIYVTTVSSNTESEKAVVKKKSRSFLKIRVPRRVSVLQMYASIYNELGYLKTFCASYLETENGFDIYTVYLDEIVIDSNIYNIKFDCNTPYGKRFFSFIGNIGYISDNEGARYQLLITDEKYLAPAWLGNGIIYHIFVDRFCKTEPSKTRSDAVYYDI